MRPSRLPKPLLLSLLAAAAFPALGEQGVEAQTRDTILRTIAATAVDDTSSLAAEGQNADTTAYSAVVHIVSGEAETGIQSSVSASTGVMPSGASFSLNPADNQFDRSRGPSTSRTASASWSAADAAWWQPSLNYSMDEEQAVPVSPMERAAAAAMPGMPTLAAHTAVAEWSQSAFRLGYRVTSAEQRPAFGTNSSAATRSTGQGAYLAVALAEGFDLQADFGADLVRDRSMPAAMRWQMRSMAAQWASVDRRWNLRSAFAQSRFAGDALLPAMSSDTVDMTVTYSLAGRPDASGVTAPQIYARLDRQSVRGAAMAAATSSNLVTYGFNVGISFAF